MLKQYYFDNSATTRTRKEVVSVMRKYFGSRYGNPSSTHKHGMVARGSVEMSRERIASLLGSKSHEIIFTGSGSEGNNTVISSVLKNNNHRKHIISSRIEHSSIFNTLEQLKSEGHDITYISVDRKGRYDLQELKEVLRMDTALVSLSYANNEVGTIQDVRAIRKIVKEKNIPLHFDAVQALPYEVINCSELGADYVTFSGHKLYAPKGIGLLYVREGSQLNPLIHGGGQEFSLRSGTENVPYIVGLAKALELNHKEKSSYNKALKDKRALIIKYIRENIEHYEFTGDLDNKVPNMVSFAIKGVNGKSLVKLMSSYNIEISSGSACSSRKDIPSRVLDALGYDDDFINGSIRISLGRYNTLREIKYLLRILKKSIEEMRSAPHTTNLDMSYISQMDFNLLLKEKEDFQFVDVRLVTNPSIAIDSVIEMPLWKLHRSMNGLSKEKLTVVSCYDGDIIAPQAQSMLIKKGFRSVKVLSGGYRGLMNYQLNEAEI